jgi:chromosome segregation ATPase
VHRPGITRAASIAIAGLLVTSCGRVDEAERQLAAARVGSERALERVSVLELRIDELEAEAATRDRLDQLRGHLRSEVGELRRALDEVRNSTKVASSKAASAFKQAEHAAHDLSLLFPHRFDPPRSGGGR